MIFGVLTALFETPKIDSFYALQNALGSTVDFALLRGVGSGGGGLFRMVVVVLFLAVSFHCCVFPRPGAYGAAGSESNPGTR